MPFICRKLLLFNRPNWRCGIFKKMPINIFAIVSILFMNCLAFWLAAHSWVNQSEVSSIQTLGKVWFDRFFLRIPNFSSIIITIIFLFFLQYFSYTTFEAVWLPYAWYMHFRFYEMISRFFFYTFSQHQ